MNLITGTNITLAFENTVVSKNINFTVSSGDYLCIVGENGAGKSTLLKAILGLHKQKEGEIIYSDNFSKNQVGYLPQSSIIQKDFPASVMEVVMSGCINKLGKKPFFNKHHKNLAINNLKKLDILDLKNISFQNLSGGQKQRVLLARALCATDKLLVLDEPITGLDAKTTIEFYDLIKALNEEENITVIMISHDLKEATKYASHILHLAKEPIFFGTKVNYLQTDYAKLTLGY